MVIRLSNEVRVAAVTLEHISKMITPDKSISSAPRRDTIQQKMLPLVWHISASKLFSCILVHCGLT